MTKQDIKNDYAIKHNFSSWKELYLSFYWVDNYEGFLVHENAVIDLIQKECLRINNREDLVNNENSILK